MTKYVTSVKNEEIIAKYEELNSSIKVAHFFNISTSYVKRILKEAGVLRNLSQAASRRVSSFKGKKHSLENRIRMSNLAKERTGEKNPFFNRRHSEKTKNKMRIAAKERTGKRNPNYRHGNYKRRTKDFLIHEFKEVRDQAFINDNYTCQFCAKKGGDLHAHHRIPYWVCKEAYLDVENLIICCKACHLAHAHNGDYAKFNTDLITQKLIEKYNLDRERLNELADFKNKKSDAIV
jgi:5-methylcytosine-specific restriction endonuclease McrA